MEVPGASRWSRAFLHIAWLRKRQVRDEVYAPMLRNALKALAEEKPPDQPDEWISKSRADVEAAEQSGVEIAHRILRAKVAGEDLSSVQVERPWTDSPFYKEMVRFLGEFDRYGRRF